MNQPHGAEFWEAGNLFQLVKFLVCLEGEDLLYSLEHDTGHYTESNEYLPHPDFSRPVLISPHPMPRS
jgi:hypothetical protein